MRCKVCKKLVDYQEKNQMCDFCYDAYLRLTGEDYVEETEEVEEDPRKLLAYFGLKIDSPENGKTGKMSTLMQKDF